MWRLETEEKREEFYRLSILKAIDTCWIDQVDNLQQLKSFVSFRQIAQRNSVFEYYQESLDSYEKMEHDVKKLIVRNIMLSTIEGNLEKGLSIYFV